MILLFHFFRREGVKRTYVHVWSFPRRGRKEGQEEEDQGGTRSHTGAARNQASALSNEYFRPTPRYRYLSHFSPMIAPVRQETDVLWFYVVPLFSIGPWSPGNILPPVLVGPF